MNEISTTHSFRCDLNTGPCEAKLDTPLMHQDALGDIFHVSLWQGRFPADLSDVTATGYLYLAATQQTILLPGTVSASSASVTLSSGCYAVPGRASLVIQLRQGSIRHTVLKVDFTIARTSSDKVIDPGAMVPSLAELLAQIAAMEQATAAANAAASAANQAAAESKAAVQTLSSVAAPPIVPTAAGDVVSVADSAERPLVALRLFGRTRQNGVPSPTVPAALMHAGSAGHVEVQVQGKNLLDSSVWADTSFDGLTSNRNADGSIRLQGTNTASYDVNHPTTASLVLQPGTYSLTGGSATEKCYLVLSYQHNGKTQFIVSPSSFVVDEANTVALIYLQTAAGATVDATIYPQLERGSAQTAYEPWKAVSKLNASTPNGLPGIPVNSGGNYMDDKGQEWLCDELDFGRGVYVQRIARYTLDGSIPPNAYNDIYGHMRFEWNGEGFDVQPLAYARTDMQLCNRFAPSTAPLQLNDVNGTISTYASGGIYLRYDGASSIETMTAYLAANPVEYLYAMQSPIDTALSASDMAAFRTMMSLYPNTTLSNNADVGMAVSYTADTKNYIDKKLAAIAAAALN